MFMTAGERIPDVAPYLTRINLDAYVTHGIPAPSLSFLDELIYSHHCSVPFENIEIYDDKRVPSLDVEALFDKIVVRNRGGYCFELNALFSALLKELGFDAYPCFTQEWESTPQPPLHRATIVKLNAELYYCDVGFGGPIPAWALKIADGYCETRHADTYKFDRIDDWFWVLSRCKDVAVPEKAETQHLEQKLQTVCLFPQQAENFIAPHYYCSTQEPFFTQQRLLNLKTSDGYYAITNMQFKKRAGRETYTEELHSEERLQQVMREYFSIEL